METKLKVKSEKLQGKRIHLVAIMKVEELRLTHKAPANFSGIGIYT
jgi:hypothetical protein